MLANLRSRITAKIVREQKNLPKQLEQDEFGEDKELICAKCHFPIEPSFAKGMRSNGRFSKDYKILCISCYKKRNLEIYRSYKFGAKIKQLVAKYHITGQRIRQIIKKETVERSK
jgi:hypothetical protein